MINNDEIKRSDDVEEKSESGSKALSFLKNKFGGFKKNKDKVKDTGEQDIYPLW